MKGEEGKAMGVDSAGLGEHAEGLVMESGWDAVSSMTA